MGILGLKGGLPMGNAEKRINHRYNFDIFLFRSCMPLLAEFGHLDLTLTAQHIWYRIN